MPDSLIAAFLSALLLLPSLAVGEPFSHPGLLHNVDEITSIREKLDSKQEPWQSAWQQLTATKYADLSLTPQPIARVDRGLRNDPDIGSTEMTRDANAAYAHALIWVLSDDEAHGKKAIELLNAWSSTLDSISGHDARLLAGMNGAIFCNAAELIRHTNAGWSTTEQQQFELMLREIFYPTIKDFYPDANGNWDASMIQTLIAMGIYLDDRDMFDRGVSYYRNGKGNGAIRNYINEFGQCQESGRDQVHVQMGLGFLSCACEMAWKQGVDLYREADNRLALGYEYTAKYNLGEDVPYQRVITYQERYDYKKISTKARGKFRPIYERVVHHYQNRKNISLPYSSKVAEKRRPEKQHYQHLSYGTLMYYQSGKENN